MAMKVITICGTVTKDTVASMMIRKGWNIKVYKSQSGSEYVDGTQGYKRVKVRISDHPLSKTRMSRIPKKHHHHISFDPYSTATLFDLSRILDGY